MSNNLLKKIFILIFSFAASLILFTACDNDPSSTAAFTGVRVIDNTYSPPVVRINEGGKVRFNNWGNNPHNVIAVDETWGSYEEIPKGDYLDVSYESEGLYKYLCSFHASPDGEWGMVGSVVVGDINYEDYTNFSKQDVVEEYSGNIRHVPDDYETIQDAVNDSDPGDLVLIKPGIYYEEVVVNVPSITIRGWDRNKTIIDGEFERGNGILVAGVDGVTIENITARNALLNGFYWATVRGYRGSYLTAYNNGDYGVYAFDAVDGVLDHSYATGSPDAGFYIGQCYPCDAIVNNVVSEYNGLGYSGTNSGGSLYITSSIFRNNKGGLAPNTLDSELLPPERETFIIGNLIENNNNYNSPATNSTYLSYGNGVVIAGGNNNIIKNNVIVDHDLYGVILTASMDVNYWPAHGNRVEENLILSSRKADIAVSGVSNLANCFEGNYFNTSIPPGLQALNGCKKNIIPLSADLSGLWSTIARLIYANTGDFYQDDWRTLPVPEQQENMPIMQEIIDENDNGLYELGFYQYLPSFRNSIKPAVNVYENYKYTLKDVQLPKEAIKYLN
tara:strand:- start:4118 stop:5797 length:1680 start_codon:yes stop_codon:yes gene_type:complete